MATPTSAISIPLPRTGDVLCGKRKEFKPFLKKVEPPKMEKGPEEMMPPTDLFKTKPAVKPSIVPRENDVLCGKTRQCLVHQGSVKFRYLIESYTERYEAAEDKYSKMSLTREIYQRVSQTSRFLRYNQKEGGWEELTAAVARDKVGHALRFSSLRRSKKPRRSRAPPSKEIAFDSKPGSPVPAAAPSSQPQVSAASAVVQAAPLQEAPRPMVIPTSQPQAIHVPSSSPPAPPQAVQPSSLLQGAIMVPGNPVQQQAEASAPQQALSSLLSNYLLSFPSACTSGATANSTVTLLVPAQPTPTPPVAAANSTVIYVPSQPTPTIPLASVQATTPDPTAPPTTSLSPPVPTNVSPVSTNNVSELDSLLHFIDSYTGEMTLDTLLDFLSPANDLGENSNGTTTSLTLEPVSSSPEPLPTVSPMPQAEDPQNCLQHSFQVSNLVTKVQDGLQATLTVTEDPFWMDNLFD